MEEIGKGLSCSSKSEAYGELIYVKNIDDVINLIDDAEGKICLIDDAATGKLAPILSDLKGILCTTGSAGSHLAIVSREFDLPCIMNINLELDDPKQLNGKKGKIITEDDNLGVLYILR